MGKKSVYLLIYVFLISITAFGQNQENNLLSKGTTNTKVDLQRIIRLEKDSKTEELIIDVKQKTQRLELLISSSVSYGKLTIEFYNPKGIKQGNITVGTQLSSKKEEIVKGNIRKALIEPQPGKWKVKIIPTNATGSIRIQTAIVE